MYGNTFAAYVHTTSEYKLIKAEMEERATVKKKSELRRGKAFVDFSRIIEIKDDMFFFLFVHMKGAVT